jgi:hypothetical protein
MKTKININKYTLIEYLIVAGMFLFLMTFMLMFFNKGTKLCRQFTSNAYNNQQILILKNRWRKFIHKQSKKDLFCKDHGKLFSAKNESVKIKDQYIIFSNKNKTSSYKLSKNMDITFKIEQNNDRPLAIMNIKIISPFPGGKDEIVRIVATPEKIMNGITDK